MKVRLHRYACDLCGATTGLHPRAVEARWAAKRAGWHLPAPGQGRWVICPTCLHPPPEPADPDHRPEETT